MNGNTTKAYESYLPFFYIFDELSDNTRQRLAMLERESLCSKNKNTCRNANTCDFVDGCGTVTHRKLNNTSKHNTRIAFNCESTETRSLFFCFIPLNGIPSLDIAACLAMRRFVPIDITKESKFKWRRIKRCGANALNICEWRYTNTHLLYGIQFPVWTMKNSIDEMRVQFIREPSNILYSWLEWNTRDRNWKKTSKKTHCWWLQKSMDESFAVYFLLSNALKWLLKSISFYPINRFD